MPLAHLEQFHVGTRINSPKTQKFEVLLQTQNGLIQARQLAILANSCCVTKKFGRRQEMHDHNLPLGNFYQNITATSDQINKMPLSKNELTRSHLQSFKGFSCAKARAREVRTCAEVVSLDASNRNFLFLINKSINGHAKIQK